MNSEEFPIREPDAESPDRSEISSERWAFSPSEPDFSGEDQPVPNEFDRSAAEDEDSNWPSMPEPQPETDETALEVPEREEVSSAREVIPPLGARDFSPAIAPQGREGRSLDQTSALDQRIAELQRQEADLKRAVAALQETYTQKLQQQMSESQSILSRILKEGLSDLERRKQELRLEIEQLERRQDRIRAEMRQSFAGVSQDLAIRVQGFKDYLVGSLQDLAAAAEQLELSPRTEVVPSPRAAELQEPSQTATRAPRFTEDRFENQVRRIRGLLDQYRTRPDYYGPPWQLRRTFEPIHAERVSNWFFEQGGRGALRTMGSRLQNILVASAVISVLKDLYGDRLRTLVLINSPERLGEWRRGLQDCLGISRADFGTERGVVLFEDPEPLAQRADRLLKSNLIPLIIIDESEDKISLSVLQFPLWLAFAPDPLMPPPAVY